MPLAAFPLLFIASLWNLFDSKLLLSASGMVVPSKTKIVCHFSTLVLTCGQQHTLQIVPRDEYDNPTSNSVSLIDEHNYSLSIHEVSAASSPAA